MKTVFVHLWGRTEFPNTKYEKYIAETYDDTKFSPKDIDGYFMEECECLCMNNAYDNEGLLGYEADADEMRERGEDPEVISDYIHNILDDYYSKLEAHWEYISEEEYLIKTSKGE